MSKEILDNNLDSFNERLPILNDRDIVNIRSKGRKFASDLGFRNQDQTLIATALSEICRNVIEHAGKGEVIIKSVIIGKKIGISFIVKDNGPGIKNLDRALQFGYTTGRGMGVGLSGTKRIMDEFELETKQGVGTTVTMTKWLNEFEY